MTLQTTPKQMAKKLARILRPERPDYAYLKKVFQHTRVLLAVEPTKKGNGFRNFSPIANWSRSTKRSGRPAIRSTWS